VVAEVVTGGVKLTNNSGQPIAFAVWDAGFLGLLGQCSNVSPICLRLASGASEIVKSDDIAGFGATGTVNAYWWHVIPDGAGGHKAGPMNTITVNAGK